MHDIFVLFAGDLDIEVQAKAKEPTRAASQSTRLAQSGPKVIKTAQPRMIQRLCHDFNRDHLAADIKCQIAQFALLGVAQKDIEIDFDLADIAIFNRPERPVA